MNEVQRLQYLDAMGIDTYMPRWVLPNAPAAVLCEPVTLQSNLGEAAVADTDQVSGVGNRAHKLSTRMAARVDDVLSIVSTSSPANSGQEVMPLKENHETAVPQSGATSEMTVRIDADVRFSLSFWRISDEVLVVDSRHSELALPTESLLGNILLALGHNTPIIPRAEVISWPMFENVSAPQGEAAAREAIAAMLEGMLEFHPIKYCLLMGEEAGYFVLPAESILALPQSEHSSRAEVFSLCLGKTFPLASLNATAIIVPSLAAMLQEPGLKAVTWKSIQPLRLR